ncbi:unnamed protein product [Rotaria sp. Silwood2]|nr:unnamed protein product [Rotaria sp. Silwood2]CAF3317345.1 unnamed protein product [Rotaria sp. Silwood2]CAF4130877.1 unnamed protein product [Rotaria sp. Silwood2]CAF4185978.1 unnamed protein product [Rotaria sp. Silwood2]
MISNNTLNADKTIEKATFEGNPFKCRVAFTRGQNPSTPTIVSPKANLVKGDLFVINLNDDGTEQLVMEVDSVDNERPIQTLYPEIFIDELIRRTFTSITFVTNHYMVQKVAAKEHFALYLVEMQVKEQYFSRGDMWRFTRKLVNTTVYLKKTLDIFGMRTTVYGLWVPDSPYRVSSGYITKDTKIVFRSLSASCTIFLQMSKEMWDFDHRGDTYYEKAVDGFFHDLFTRWKQMLCQHDVTMTLFSRVFYSAKSLDDFPQSLQQDINIDHRGRFYEDFYRVIYQNERYDDWLPRLGKMKQVIINYKEDLVNYHKKHLTKAEADKMPNGTISCASDGNFLETLNLSSSVFERHYIDRAFDCLGQMSLVITPGAGVFEVDRELTNMTKQRVLDNGIGSDLVCLGEQPLFAVPLFKFFQGDPNTADDYQIPHWMNLSYYRSSTAPSCFKRYIPRLPFDTNRILGGMLEVKNVMNSIEENTFTKPPHLSMEEYDAQVFRTSTKNIKDHKSSNRTAAKGGEARKARKRNITMSPTHPASIEEEDDTLHEPSGMLIVNNKAALSTGINDDPRQFNANVKDDISLSTSHTSASIAGNLQYHNTYNQSAQVLFYHPQSLLRAARSADTYFLTTILLARMQARPKALTNPFAPASIRIPMVPGRRRWAHTFPIGPNKIPWHFHHLRKMEGAIRQEMLVSIINCAHLVLPSTSKHILNGFISKRTLQHTKTHSDTSSRPKRIVSPSSFEIKREPTDRKDSCTDDNRPNINGINMKKPSSDSTSKPPSLKKEKKEAIIWGPTGVEPWSASMITGIDWKSLTIPASLPTTFDVEPTEDDLKRDYTHNSYELIHCLPPLNEYERKRRHVHNGSGTYDKLIHSDPMERQRSVFDDLIDQRLSQGFQMIVEIPLHIQKLMIEKIRRVGYKETEYNRLLSIGRIYHTLSLVTEDKKTQDTVVICVQQFKPQYVFQPKVVQYKYRFQCPDSSKYEPDRYELKLESLESFPWNIVDNAVCSHGMGDHIHSDTMKFWRTRLVVMPVARDYTIKSIESGQRRCDSRQEMSHEDFFLYVEHFIRFLLMLNKLTRTRAGSNDVLHRPLDPVTGLKRLDCHKRQGKHSVPCKTFKLDGIMSGDSNAINNLLTLCRDEQQGLSFIKDAVLPENSFIAVEAVWWSIEHCDDIQNEQTGLSLFQTLFERGYIRHCTHSENLFRFGFFIYYIVTDKTQNFHLDSNDYAEVEFHQTQHFIPSMDYLGFGERKPMRLLPKLIVNQQSIPRPIRLATSLAAANTNSTSVNNTAEDPTLTNQEITSTILKRTCHVDADQKHISDRREWATAQHHAYYNPHCLFEIEIRWLVVTSCILGDLITNWSQRTGTILGSNQVAFHLIPIPCDPFAEFDPLRGPIYIKMDSSCLRDKIVDLSEKDQNLRLNIFQELILKRYGFILNACVSYKDENIFYVHLSGGMLVYIISDVYNVHRNRQSIHVASKEDTDSQLSQLDCGFYWCWNFCLGKKWRSSQTGEEKYQDIMLADFRAFCANDKNRLINYWNEVNEIANEKMAENQQK